MTSIIKNKFIKVYRIFGYIIFFLLIFFDLYSFGKPTIAKYGTYVWLLSNLYLIIFTIKAVIDLFILIPKGKSIFSLIIISIFFLTIFLNLTELKTVSGESTDEINCTLNNLLTSPDKGYFQTCLFGYPDRQFFLPALFSLKERTIFNLNFGESLYFLLGIIIFSRGVLKYFKDTFRGDLLNSIFLSLIFHIYYFNNFIFLARQGIIPFSLGLILVGIFLSYLSNRDKFPLYLFGFLFLYLIYSYTPSLSIYFLAIIVTTGLMVEKKTNEKQKVLFLLIIVFTLLSYVISLNVRSDIKIFAPETRGISQLQEDVLVAFKHLIFQDAGHPYVSPVVNYLFLFSIMAPLFFSFGLKPAIISCWVIATLAISVISSGYCYYGIDFRLHRSTIIFPVIFGLYTILIARNVEKINYKLLLSIIFLILTTGYLIQRNYLNQTNPHQNVSLIFNRLIPELQKRGNINLKGSIYFIGDTATDFGSINGFLQYFAPKLIVNFFPSEFPENCQYLNSGFYVIKKDHPCYEKMIENNNSDKIPQTKVLGVKNSNSSDFPNIDIIYKQY